MNWRRPTIKFGCEMTNNIMRHLETIRTFQVPWRKSVSYTSQFPWQKIYRILDHARKNVPYYRNMPNYLFEDMPVLTKDIIREQGERMYSKDHRQRDSYFNTSGGSTGEPIKILQDRNYRQWNVAHKLFQNYLQGVGVGEREIKLWGAGRDIHFEDIGKHGLKPAAILRYWLFNVYHLDAFAMNEQIMAEHVKKWNKLKPKLIWTYLSSILEFGRYVKENDIELHKPKSIICTSETFSEEARVELESIFGCSVVNQYGGREVGTVGIECPDCHNLHIFSLHNYVEVVDGEILITTLNNYSMPLIRYRIGDTAEAGDCDCGRPWPTIKRVTGRVVDHFRKEDGTMIYGERLTHIFYHKDYVKAFQIVQKDYKSILVKLVPAMLLKKWMLVGIKNEIRDVLGDVNVCFEINDSIEKTRTGKHRYTICEMSNVGV